MPGGRRAAFVVESWPHCAGTKVRNVLIVIVYRMMYTMCTGICTVKQVIVRGLIFE